MRSPQLLDPRVAQQQQQVDLMRSMGLLQDPLQQATSLVNLLNTTEAPGIQQQQFDREFGLRELVAQQDEAARQQQFANQQGQQQWQQGMAEREFGLQQGNFDQGSQRLQMADEQFQQQMQQRQQEQLMNLFAMGFGAQDPQTMQQPFNLAAFAQLGESIDPRLAGLLQFTQGADPGQQPLKYLPQFTQAQAIAAGQ